MHRKIQNYIYSLYFPEQKTHTRNRVVKHNAGDNRKESLRSYAERLAYYGTSR